MFSLRGGVGAGRGVDAETVAQATLLAGMILLGGSSVSITTMVAELLAVISLCLSVARLDAAAWRATRPAWIVAALLLLLAVVELAPLPWFLWAQLPGRDTAKAVWSAAAVPPSAHAISLDPGATISSLLATLPGLATFMAVLKTRPHQRRVYFLVISSCAALSMILGAVQVAIGGLYLYRQSNVGLPIGIISNRNHQADLLSLGALFTVLLSLMHGSSNRRGGLPILAIALLCAFALGAIATHSRMGTALFLAAGLSMVASRRAIRSSWRALLLLLVTGGAIASLVYFNPVVAKTFARYRELSEDLRPVIWSNTEYQIHNYWPTGAGLGTFVPVYAQSEPLDTLTSTYINHAHNDYLELALDLGIGGVAAVAFYLLWLAASLVGAWRETRADFETWVAVTGLALLLVHSLVDYPLRMPALLAIFGLLNAMVATKRQELSPSRRVRESVPGEMRRLGEL